MPTGGGYVDIDELAYSRSRVVPKLRLICDFGRHILRTFTREKEEERKIMLSKKAIAAFAAGATLVSGLALTVPALADNPSGGTSTTQSNQVTKLENVVFNFKVGDKDHKTTATTLYKKGDKYGTAQDDVNYTAAQIGAGFLAQVQNNLTPAEGNGIVDGIVYPSVINSGENVVTVKINNTLVDDATVITMANFGDYSHFEEVLKKAGKTITPAQKALFNTQRAKVEKAALIAEAERFGLPKSVVDALKDYAKYKDPAAVAKLLEQGKRAAVKQALSRVNGDTVADYKLHPADVSELVGGKGQTPVVPTPAVDPAIEA
ncbi:hypothetical protein HMPREF3208_00470, partial [Gardnerella vaginalis]